MNEQDSKANTKALDALLNYETVKYFSNERFEQARYDDNLHGLEKASIKSQTSLSLLNLGQSLIIAVTVTLLVWRATAGVVAGTMTIGDLVLVNALMIQLYIPLNFLGVIYREIKQSMIDMEKMFALLGQNREIADAPDATALVDRGGAIRFEHVRFGYEPDRDHPARRELRDPGRPDRGRRRPVGLGQEHAGAAAVPLLRRRRGPDRDRRPGHPQRHAEEPARGDRHRPAGHGALQRHGAIQHRLRADGGRPGGGRGGGARGPHPRLHRLDAEAATTRWSASAASSSRAARSSASRSPAPC